MRTRPDAHHEAVTRRLALLHAGSPTEEWPDDEQEEGVEEDTAGSAWWDAHTSVARIPRGGDQEPGSPALAFAPPAVPVVRPVAMPVPGRHAARRGIAFAPSLPEPLRGRLRLGPAQLAVVALALVIVLVATCWWLARGRATTLTSRPVTSATASPLVALASPAATPAAEVSGEASVTAASPGSMVTVDVEGKVRHPGIVIVPAGSRVTDALRAAGGVPHHRALGGLNLAAVLVDGQQIMVGTAAPAAGAAAGAAGKTSAAGDPGAGADGTAATGQPINLNTATAEQLDTLPGVGPVTAQSILEWREQNGGFTSVQELLEVDGIGPATLAKLAPHVTV